jgi:hypothetical protein
MPRLTVRTPGYAVLLGSGPLYQAAPSGQTVALSNLLAQATSPQPQTVDVNIATGFAGIQSGTAITPQAVVARLHRGRHWVDYGHWPFGSYGAIGGVTAPDQAGFGAFMAAAGLTRQVPHPPLTDHAGAVAAAACLPHTGVFNGNDPYAFALCDWTWGAEAKAKGYPYAFGFPTLLSQNTRLFRAMPGVPVAHGLGAYGVSVYGAFALRVGRGWYFMAQPTVGIRAYAAFIADTLGATLPAAAVSGPVACRTPVKPDLRPGDTGPWVALAQARLNAWGAHLAVDGDFGPLTEQAVLALQRAHAGQQVDGAPPITISGDIGPGLWALLCSAPPVSIRGGGPPPSPGHPTRPTTGSGGRCGSPVVSRIAQATHLSCTEAEIVLIGGALTLLAMLSNR